MPLHRICTQSGRFVFSVLAAVAVTTGSGWSSAGTVTLSTSTTSVAAETIELSTGPTTVRLTPPAGIAAGEPLADRLNKLSSEQRIFLVLGDLATAKQPGVLYDIYLDLPESIEPNPNDPRFVGTVNFFAAPASEIAADHRPSHVIEITNKVRTLEAAGLLNDRTTVTVVPIGAPSSDASPRIGRVEILAE